MIGFACMRIVSSGRGGMRNHLGRELQEAIAGHHRQSQLIRNYAARPIIVTVRDITSRLAGTWQEQNERPSAAQAYC